MKEQKQIEEMAIEMSGCGKSECAPCRLYRLGLCAAYKDASRAISAGYRKQIAGEWTYSEDKKTMKCTRCRLRMKTYDVRRFCPNCGVKMRKEDD